MRPPSIRLAISLGLLVTTSASWADDAPPAFPREFRAAWVATVANIDWPSRPGLSTDAQKREAVAILDRSAAIGLNAIILQVRPSADALYESALEPWSAFLSGTQGKRPDPYYDPLAFWVAEAHRRGLQLHAWFNPYRARYQGANYEEVASHVARARPDLTRKYGGLLWMDPGEPDAIDHTFKVLLDVVKRYDIDGVHFDDYFYPYPIADRATKAEVPFPDDPSWKAYQSRGGKLARGDWRRENINTLIRRLAEGIHREKPGVLFGISPFGIPRPGQPKGVVGFDQYEKLSADAVKWLREGWCDYCSPQLYWKVDAPGQPFRPLLDEWIRDNPKGRHLWPGLSVSRVSDRPTGYAPEEIARQIAILRSTPGASGHVLFSMKTLMADRRKVATLLETETYKAPALIPASPWLKQPAPSMPSALVDRQGDRLAIRPTAGPGPSPFVWAVAARRGRDWTLTTHPAGAGPIVLPGGVDLVRLTAVGRTGEAGPPASIAVQK